MPADGLACFVGGSFGRFFRIGLVVVTLFASAVAPVPEYLLVPVRPPLTFVIKTKTHATASDQRPD